MSTRTWCTALLLSALIGSGSVFAANGRAAVDLRGQPQKLVMMGPADGRPIIVSSGDGGWIHLAPHVAASLAARGFRVIGFDTRAYLEGFTAAASRLNESNVREDYSRLIDFAAHGSRMRPILVGVSEGAGLSVLAATDPQTTHAIAGVIALGLPNVNELAWRWKDSVVYITHGIPKEPTFRVDQLVPHLGTLPLAAVHSTQDEFSPLSDVERIVASASGPQRVWKVAASDHRFSDNLASLDTSLLEAVDWIVAHEAR